MRPNTDARSTIVVDGWFDGERRHAGPTTLKVVDGRLVGVTPGDHGRELAGSGWPLERGAFLLPGLVDAHVHLFLDGAPTDAKHRADHLKRPLDELMDAARASARQTLQCGVTRVRDAGDRHGINHRVREEARRCGSQLAHVRSAGLGVKRAKRYGAFMAADVGDEASIVRSVGELTVENDEIKLILTGIIDFDAGAVTDEPQFTLDEARLVVTTAHAHGRRVMAHCSGAKGLAVAVGAGVDSIEHGFFMDRETLSKMRDAGLAWTPTFCPVHFQWAHPEAVGWSQNTVGNLRRILDRHAEMLRVAHQLGVRLLVGTDAGSMGVEHGHAVVDEIGHFIAAGLPVDAALHAATAAPRSHFGDAHPRLELGAPFEALLLDADPARDLGALRRPRRVWRAPAEHRFPGDAPGRPPAEGVSQPGSDAPSTRQVAA
ncbi:MAG: amidohydrolase family protein [Burkholderiaceae bacterium]|nr:amidohydrolase family protein [Burkholderiaceae bacterium]